MTLEMKDILRAAASYYDLSKADLVGPCRKQHMAHPRHITAAAIHKGAAGSLSPVAHIMGRDHTTIINSLRFVDDLERGEKKSPYVKASDRDLIISLAEKFAGGEASK
jgi:chromosomal replication initiation ATPase DnaA